MRVVTVAAGDQPVAKTLLATAPELPKVNAEMSASRRPMTITARGERCRRATGVGVEGARRAEVAVMAAASSRTSGPVTARHRIMGVSR
ncbi:hypothetical protein GCM10009584_29770 [Ornithinimicrobium humiphilum]